jgi:hypothetical protein
MNMKAISENIGKEEATKMAIQAGAGYFKTRSTL